MSKKYLIKLKPLGLFFFSQETKYRRKRGGSFEADYYQVSAHFPQQTALLGMLRYFILQVNSQIPINNATKAKNLIGNKSFDVGETNPDYKTIKNLSAVFILDKNDKPYYISPKDLILKNNKPEYLSRTLAANIRTNITDKLLIFPNYVEKDGLDNFLIHSYTECLPLEYDKKNKKNVVFIPVEKVGITKSKSGKTLDKAFYKQVFYKLNEGFSFGFFAEIEEDKLVEKEGFVPLGTEKSAFSITFEEHHNNFKALSLNNTNSPRIVLLSDAYLSDYNTKDFQFAISATKTFRFLKTEVNASNTYYAGNPVNASGGITRSIKYNLFERGSIFYFEDENKMNVFSDKLNNEKNFIQIGYNQHLKIN